MGGDAGFLPPPIGLDHSRIKNLMLSPTLGSAQTPQKKYLLFLFPELGPSSFDRSRRGEDDGDNEKPPDPPKDRLLNPISKKVNIEIRKNSKIRKTLKNIEFQYSLKKRISKK